MALPNAEVGQIYRYTIFGRLNGQRTMNSQDYRLEVLPAPLDVLSAGDAINTAWDAPGGRLSAYLSCVPDNMTVEKVRVQVLAPVRAINKDYTKNVPGTGPAANTPNLQQSIEKRGEKATRYAVGGMRLPLGSGAAAILDGVLTIGQKNALQAFADVLKNQIGDGVALITFRPVVYNRSFIPNYTYVFTCVAQSTARTQHRRTVGLGE